MVLFPRGWPPLFPAWGQQRRFLFSIKEGVAFSQIRVPPSRSQREHSKIVCLFMLFHSQYYWLKVSSSSYNSRDASIIQHPEWWSGFSPGEVKFFKASLVLWLFSPSFFVLSQSILIHKSGILWWPAGDSSTLLKKIHSCDNCSESFVYYKGQKHISLSMHMTQNWAVPKSLRHPVLPPQTCDLSLQM